MGKGKRSRVECREEVIEQEKKEKLRNNGDDMRKMQKGNELKNQ